MEQNSAMERLVHRVRGIVERGERIAPADARSLFSLHDLNFFSRLASVARERRYGRDGRFSAYETLEIGVLSSAEVGDLLACMEETTDVVIQPAGGRSFSLKEWCEGVAEHVGPKGNRKQFVRLDPVDLVPLLGDRDGMSEIIETLGGGEFCQISGAAPFGEDELWSRHASLLDFEPWIATQKMLIGLGLACDASVVYHDDTDLDRVVHQMTIVRELQDETGGFRRFLPLPYTAEGYADELHRKTPGAAMTLKMSAISRLFFDNIDHIASPIRMIAPEIAFVALSHGADTIDLGYRASDAEPRSEGGIDLTVVDPGGAGPQDPLRFVEERILESRYRPVPVDAAGRAFRLVETP